MWNNKAKKIGCKNHIKSSREKEEESKTIKTNKWLLSLKGRGERRENSFLIKWKTTTTTIISWLSIFLFLSSAAANNAIKNTFPAKKRRARVIKVDNKRGGERMENRDRDTFNFTNISEHFPFFWQIKAAKNSPGFYQNVPFRF